MGTDGAGAGAGGAGAGAAGAGGAGSGAGTTDDRKDWVPPGRLREEADARRTAERELETLRKAAGDVPTLQRQLQEFQAKEQAWGDERAAMQLGFTDPEALGVARHLHSQLPDKDRPKFSDWLGGLKADPTKAPRSLSPWLQAGAGGSSSAGTSGAAAQKAAGGQAPGNTGTGGTAGLEDNALNAIIAKAKKTGDWAEYDKHRAAVLAKIAGS